MNLTVEFPDGTLPSVERVLRRKRRKSLAATSTNVAFSLAKATAVDMLAMAEVALWARDLRELGKSVTIIAPTDREAREFLATMQFPSALASFGVTANFNDGPLVEALNATPVFPLTFLDAGAFAGLLRELADEHLRASRMALLRDSDLVQTGELAEIVLGELGDNVFRHGGGRFAHLAVSKCRAPRSLTSHRLATKGLETLLNAEYRFLDAFRGEEYICVEIGDMGPGVAATLRAAYSRDPFKPKDTKATAASVLAYAFRYDSTSRTLGDRVGELEKVISPQAREFPPVTGLYRVKELVRDFHGVLLARSGSSAVVYDFVHDQNIDRPTTSDDRRIRLADVPGLQFKILLPTRRPHSAIRYAFDARSASKTPARSIYVAADDYFQSRSSTAITGEALGLARLLDQVDGALAVEPPGARAVVLDLNYGRRLSPKAAHYLLFEAMQRQGGGRSVFVINAPKELVGSLAEMLSATPQQIARPLLAYDEFRMPHFIGAPARDAATLLAVASGEAAGDGLTAVAQRHMHLFTIGRDSGYTLRHSLVSLSQTAKDALKDRVGKALDTTPGVFDPDAKVLLPSQVYCRGYYDIPRFLTSREAREVVARWLTATLQWHNPDLVVSIGRCGAVVEEELRRAPRHETAPVKHVSLSGTATQFVAIPATLNLSRHRRALIFTDVVATKRTIATVAEALSVAEPPLILCFVNASSSSEAILGDGTTVNIESAVERRFMLHTSLPREWLYSEVCVVDPASHSLIPPRSQDTAPLWKRETLEAAPAYDRQRALNTFLRDVVAPVDGALVGHYRNGDQHFTYAFDMAAIVSRYERDIVECVLNDMRAALAAPGGGADDLDRLAVEVMYATFNPGMDRVAAALARHFRDASIVAVDRNAIDSAVRPQRRQAECPVIILDDAFSTGGTLLKLIELAAASETKRVYAYTIVRRGNEAVARRFAAITRFGHADVHTRYLAAVEMPAYTEFTCPACHRHREWGRTRARVRSEMARAIADRELARLASQPIVEVLSVASETRVTMRPGAADTTTEAAARTDSRWRLEVARRSPVEREVLMDVVRRYEEAPSECLLLLSTIGFERFPESLSAEERRQFFNVEFVGAILRALDFLVSCDALRHDELDALLHVGDSLAPDDFIEVVERLLRAPITDVRRFARVALATTRLSCARMQPAIMRRCFEDADVAGASKELQEFVDDLARHWNDVERALVVESRERFRHYRELVGGAFHELGHKKDDLLTELERAGRDNAKLLTFWSELRTAIVGGVIPLARLFSRSDVAPALRDAISRCAADIAALIGTGNGLVHRTVNSDVPDVVAREELGRIVARAYDLVYGPEGLRQLLEQFKSNVKTGISAVLSVRREDLRKAGIQILRDFTPELCLAFADESSLRGVFHNLIDNVYKHSRATRVLVKVQQNALSQEVRIVVVDDGVGYDGRAARSGIRFVRQVVHAYCGTLSFSGGGEFSGGREGTSVAITLPLVSTLVE